MKTSFLLSEKTCKKLAFQAEQETVLHKQYSHFKIIYFVKCLRLAIIFSVLTKKHMLQEVMQG